MTEKKKPIYCPYCEAEIVEVKSPLCGVCGVNIFYCPVCRKPLPRNKGVCPHCGADIQKKAAGGG